MQNGILTTYIFQVKKCNFKPIALLLHSSMCLLGMVSPGKQLFCWGWQELCTAGGEVKCLSLHRHTEMRKTPQRISVLLLSSQKIRLQLDRPLWISVASPTHITEQPDWNYAERHKLTKTPGVKLVLLTAGFKDALAGSRSLPLMGLLHACLAV